jgi:hypothetical protein
MTVIVGILCSDGVVIGSDSAMAAGRALTGYTIERQDGGVLKIEVIENNTITAVTGAMGLAQRFNEQIEATIRELRQPFQPPQQFLAGMGFIGSKVQQILAGKVNQGVIPYDAVSPVEIGRIVAEVTIDDFKRTQSTHQVSNGWGFGALFAFAQGDRPHLIDFDPTQFHPELKGLPDPGRGDQDRNWRCVSWGAGSRLADAFLAHAYRVLFGNLEGEQWKLKVPTVARAKLAVAWTVDHVRRYNTGLVGGKLQLAVLEKNINGIWSAYHADTGETEQQVQFLETYISEFREKQKPDAAAEASTVDLHGELDGTAGGSAG